MSERQRAEEPRTDESRDVAPGPDVEPVPAGVDLTRGEAQLEAAADQLRTLPPTERAAQAAGRILRRALSARRRAVPVATTDPQLKISSVALVAVLRDALDRGLVDAAVQRIALDVDDRVLRSVRVELVVRYRSPMPDVAAVAQDVVRAALVDVLGAGPAPGADDVERHVHVADVTMADPRLTEPVDEEVPGMRQLTVHRHVATSPDVVWSLLVDLDAWPVWGPTVRGATLDDGGELSLGSRGHVVTAVGLRLPFEVTSFDPGRSWAWRVAGVPATTHAVRPEGDGCRASMGAPLWAPAYLPVLAAALVRIETLATSQAG